MKRDSIDFANEPVGSLFRQLLFPTLAGMLSIVILNITDGAFVGHGVGSNGLASINIAAPIFTFITGIGLMFGSGCSIVSSIHLSKGNRKAADINVTQAYSAALLVAVLMSVLILTNLETTIRLFGSNDVLLPTSMAYLKWIAIFIPLNMLGVVGEFIIRLDGSPKYSMACTVVAAGLNIFLDWLFIFPLGWGVQGAGLATGISFAVSGVMVAVYMLFFSKTLHLYRLKTSWKSLRLSLRNIGYQVRMGFSSLLAEAAVSCFVIVGNIIFIKYLGETGVAAFSVACYCIPTAFMFANSITQSSQPIISFAYGTGDRARMKKARNVSVLAALLIGFMGFALLGLGAAPITTVFISRGEEAFDLCTRGIPLFSVSSVFICLNVVLIGYFQSIEQAGRATVFTLLRGFLFVIPCFVLLPKVLGVPGIWLALPLSEILTTLLIFLQFAFRPVLSRGNSSLPKR